MHIGRRCCCLQPDDGHEQAQLAQLQIAARYFFASQLRPRGDTDVAATTVHARLAQIR